MKEEKIIEMGLGDDFQMISGVSNGYSTWILIEVVEINKDNVIFKLIKMNNEE